MNRMFWFLLCSLLLVVSAHAGQTIIRETETGIYAEYIPDEADTSAAKAQQEQVEKVQAATAAAQKVQDEKRARRLVVKALNQGDDE